MHEYRTVLKAALDGEADSWEHASATCHVQITTPAGALDTASSITVSITNTARKVGPITIPVENAGPNHVLTDSMQVPFSGRWQIDVGALFGNFDKTDFVTTFTAK